MSATARCWRATPASTACSSWPSRRPASTAARSARRAHPAGTAADSFAPPRTPKRRASARAFAVAPSWPRARRPSTRCRGWWSPPCAASTRARCRARGSVDDLARELGVSGRHLRRAMQAELGVSPLALAESRRLAVARQLIVDTALPMTEVAFASGYRSLRRFNAAVKARYARPPTAMRRAAARRRRAGRVADPVARFSLPLRLARDGRLSGRSRHPRRRAGTRRRLPSNGGGGRPPRLAFGGAPSVGHRPARDRLQLAGGGADDGGGATAPAVRSGRAAGGHRLAPAARSTAGAARARPSGPAPAGRVRSFRGRGPRHPGTADQRGGRADHRRTAGRSAGRAVRDATPGADPSVSLAGGARPTTWRHWASPLDGRPRCGPSPPRSRAGGWRWTAPPSRRDSSTS